MSDDLFCKQLGAPQAKRYAKWILENGEVVYSCHARKRKRERDIDESDVHQVISRGFCSGSEWESDDNGRFSWRYKIEFDNKTVVCAFESPDTMIVVTVLRSRSQQ